MSSNSSCYFAQTHSVQPESIPLLLVIDLARGCTIIFCLLRFQITSWPQSESSLDVTRVNSAPQVTANVLVSSKFDLATETSLSSF